MTQKQPSAIQILLANCFYFWSFYPYPSNFWGNVMMTLWYLFFCPTLYWKWYVLFLEKKGLMLTVSVFQGGLAWLHELDQISRASENCIFSLVWTWVLCLFFYPFLQRVPSEHIGQRCVTLRPSLLCIHE